MKLSLFVSPDDLVRFLEGQKVEAMSTRHLPSLYELLVDPSEIEIEPATGMLRKGNLMVQKRED